MADMREGLHAKGNVLRLLKAELEAALKGADVVETRVMARSLPARISRRPSPTVSRAAGVEIKAPLPVEITPARPAPPFAASLEETLPAELTQLIGGFRDYLRLQAGAAGLQRSEVVAFVQERLREHYADRESLLKARSPITAALAGLEHATLMFGLAVAYGAEVMASGFAFEDMISANWLNWPLGFASAFLFGGGLMVITKGKEKTFWSAVAALWVVSVAIVATRNDTLVDPAHIKIGIERQDIKEKWNRLASKRAELADLDSRLARKDAGLERDKERTGGSAKYRSAVMAQSADAVMAVEAERNAVFKAMNAEEKEWNGDKRNDPSRWKAALVVFIWTSVLNVGGAWYISKYVSTRRAAHEEALKEAQGKRRARHDLSALRDSRKSQEAWAARLVAFMRGTYATSLEIGGRLSDAEVRAKTIAAFGGTEEETAGIVRSAVQGYRDSLKPRRGSWMGFFRFGSEPRP